MSRFSAGAEEVLRAIGWTEGRKVDVSGWREALAEGGLVMHHAAEVFLAEFGGLVSPFSGPGVTSAREPFELNPSLTLGEKDRFLEWGSDLGVYLYPLGEFDGGRFFLGIGDDEGIYLVVNWMAKFGVGIDGFEKLILGYQPEYIDL